MLNAPQLTAKPTCLSQRTAKASVLFRIAFLAGLLAAPALRGYPMARVIGGDDAEDGAYPWMVALVHRDRSPAIGGQFCGGVLIESNWILTAAHCIRNKDLDAFVIAVGDQDLGGTPRLIAPRMILLPPQHHHRSGRGGDLALIQLSEPAVDIQPLPYRRKADPDPLPASGRVLGWGATSTAPSEDQTRNPILQAADVPVYHVGDTILAGLVPQDTLAEYIPAGHTDRPIGASFGDSGGPLLVRTSTHDTWTLAGIDSHGFEGVDGLSMFTALSHYSDWIDAIVTTHPSVTPVGPEWVLQPIADEVFANKSPPGLVMRPFSSGPVVQLEISEDLLSWSPLEFAMAGTRAFRFNADNSFTVYPNRLAQSGEPVFLRQTVSQEQAVRRGLFTLSPYQVVRSTQTNPASTLGQTEDVFRLRGFDPGRTYHIDLTERYFFDLALLRKEKGKAIETIFSTKTPGAHPPIPFVAEPDTDYWLTVVRREDANDTFILYASHPVTLSASTGEWVEGTLSNNDTPYLLPDVRMDAYFWNRSHLGDLRIELESDFDAEISIVSSQSGVIHGYFDENAAHADETYILNSQTLNRGEIRISNFNPGELGKYRFRITPNSENKSAKVGVAEQRAITREDPRSTNEAGVDYHLEVIGIESANHYSTLTVTVTGLSGFAPLAYVYEIGSSRVVVDGYGGRVSLTFSPEDTIEYGVSVLAPDGSLDQNYILSIEGRL